MTKQLREEFVGLIWFAFILIFTLTLIAILGNASRVIVNVSCDTGGITLEDVRPAECYGNFDAAHCPVPQSISCHGYYSGPIGKIASVTG